MIDEFQFFQEMGIILENQQSFDSEYEELLYDDTSYSECPEQYDP